MDLNYLEHTRQSQTLLWDKAQPNYPEDSLSILYKKNGQSNLYRYENKSQMTQVKKGSYC